MQLMRRHDIWDPFKELETLSNRFQRMFGLARPEDQKEPMSLTDWAPSVDIVENDAGYKIRAELPDVKKDDVKVTLDQGLLTIQGERKQEKEEKGTRFHRREMVYGHFVRSFTMPEDADEAKVDATFKEGVLEVTVEKSKTKTTKVKQIAVH